MHRGDSKVQTEMRIVSNKKAPPVHGADGTQSIRTRFLRLFPCPDFLIALLPGAHSNTANRRLYCSESRSELRSLLLPHRSRSSRTPDSALARFRIGMSRERRLSARTPVSLRQKPVLTSFGSGQQVGELWSPAQLREQGVSLQGSVRA